MVNEWSENSHVRSLDQGNALRVCNNCQREFNPRGAKHGAVNCPTCDRRMGNGW